MGRAQRQRGNDCVTQVFGLQGVCDPSSSVCMATGAYWRNQRYQMHWGQTQASSR